MLRLLVAAALVLWNASVSAQSHPPAQREHVTTLPSASQTPAAATPAAAAPANKTPQAPARAHAKPTAKTAVPVRAQGPPRTTKPSVAAVSHTWPRYVLRWVEERWQVTWPTPDARIALTWPQP
jgi:hypothetical protein